ncbi:MAG: hypothetical protein JRJ01_11770 [Deltaproteobacteria bacterium]|nr:hypothetical protein [Deltaproteobacteria bacterium]
MMFKLAREAASRFDVDPYYLVSNESIQRFLLEKGIGPGRIIYLNSDIVSRIHDGKPADIRGLEKMEEKYGIPNLMLFWEGMRIHKGYTYEDSLKRMEAVFEVTERMFLRHDFDFALVDTLVANMQMMFLLALFETHGRPFYCISSCKIPGRFVVTRGFDERYPLLEKVYGEIKHRALTPEEEGLAEEFLLTFKEKKQPERLEDAKIRGRRILDPGRIGRGLHAVWESYRFGSHTKGIRRHGPLAPLKYITNNLVSEIKAKLYRRLPLFEAPGKGEKYMVFFLHKQPEATTFVKAPFFLNQEAVVENIAKSLPIGVRLYVKPHFNDFGGKPLSFYKNLVSRPNIKLIKVDADPIELVRNSLGVITITGTVGWEGLLMGKPVLTLGSIFYNVQDQVMHLTDMTRLPEKLQYAVHEYEPDEVLAKKFIVAMFKSSHEGVIAPPAFSPKVLSGENIRLIVDGLEREGVFRR